MSSSPENCGMKHPIRRLEIQINNFNVAIPHHVGLLKRHKNNIEKYQAQHDWDKIHKEHINVSRIIKQLKELLCQMDTLRGQVLDADINQFDNLTANARISIMNAINEYLELELNIPISQPASPQHEDQAPHHPLEEKYAQLQEEQDELERQQTCLFAWNSLQSDILQLRQLFVDFNKIVHDQKELLNTAENDMEETQINVNEGEKFLEKAARYKVFKYPLAGALIGTCVGGPIGLIAGLKMGGITALGLGVLGYTGGSLIKKKQLECNKPESSEKLSSTQQKTVQNSASVVGNLNENKKEL